jgi:hypothetical protein
MGDAIGEILDVVSTVAAFVPGPWQVPAMAYRGMKAVSEGNLIGAAMSAYGLNGAGGFSDFGGGEFGGDFGGDYGIDMGIADTGYTPYGGGDFFGNDFGTFSGVDGDLGALFSPDYAQGAQDFAAGWGDNPILSPEGAMGANNMGQGLGQLPTGGVAPDLGLGTDSLGGTPTSALSTPSGMPSEMNPDMTGQASGNYTGGTPTQPTTLEGITSGGGESTFQTEWAGPKQVGANATWDGSGNQGYDYQNKDFLSGKTGTGMNANTSGLDLYKPDLANATGTAAPFKQGLEMNNLPDMYKRMTSPVGGGSPVQGMSPLTMGIKGFGALDSLFQNRKAMDMTERQFNAANNWTDPNRARGDVANQEWMKTQQDPRYGYDSFMQGAGRDFTNQARAQAAKSGNRGGYLNSGRMNSDLASLWQKNQSQRAESLRGGFAGGQNNYAATASAAPGYAQMMRNANAPVFDVLGEISKNRSLVDMFGGE